MHAVPRGLRHLYFTQGIFFGSHHRPPSIVEMRDAARGFFLRVLALVVKHVCALATRAPAFLPPDFFHRLLLHARHAALLRLKLVAQFAPRQKAVQRLRALPLALDLESAGPVPQPDAGRERRALPAGRAVLHPGLNEARKQPSCEVSRWREDALWPAPH